MPPKRKGKYNLPVPLQEGIILKDTEKREWRLGRMIAQGGFGLIYLASPHIDRPVDDKAEHVIKVEYLENGPLFSELKFYQRAAKQEDIKKWMKLKRLTFIGIPLFWGSGQAEHNGKSYRFMVMERLGEDLQTTFERKGRKFSKEMVLHLGVRMLNVLEYIHEREYVHGDIKAANLLFGYKNPHEVYLADYGLAYRYCPNGNHKEYQENPKKGHNGTIEFTSLDAHKGVAPSRRGDLEILGYCMLQWVCGSLPWEHSLRNPDVVQAAKTKLLDELPDSVTRWGPAGTDCGEIAMFLKNTSSLAYKEKPEYKALKAILLSGLPEKGASYNGMLDFTTTKSIGGGCVGSPRKRAPSQTQLSALFTLCGKAEQKFMFNKKPLDFDLEGLAEGSHMRLIQWDGGNTATVAVLDGPPNTCVFQAYLPKPAAAKQVKEVTESRLENKELAYRRKATVGMKSSQVQEKQMLAGLNKPLQTEVENTEPLQRTYLHKTSQKTEDKCVENGQTFPPVCQPKGFQMLTSPTVCINSEPVLHEELYQYLIAIAVLFFLIFLALYFL